MTLGHSSVLALEGLRTRNGREVQAGDRVLVPGASGNVGPFDSRGVFVYGQQALWWGAEMRITLDLGDEGDQEWLEAHLAIKGLGLPDILAVAGSSIARRKGRRLYAYGRGAGGSPVVVVLMRTGIGWRPRTAWRMDDVERRWWRGQGGR